jgi:steroid delta-isomerase-like uncharacterized protein
MTTVVRSLVDEYVEAWNAHDPARCARCFTEDAVREYKVLPLPLTGGVARFEGSVAVEESIRVFMDAVPDIEVTALGRSEAEAHVVLEWHVKGTHTGDWAGWTAQGEAVDFPGVSIYQFEGGLFREERMYFDNNLMAANWKPPAP